LATRATRATLDALSRRCMNIWMTVLEGHSQKDGGDDIEYSAYTGTLIDPNMVGFAVSFHFDQPRPWVRAFNPASGQMCEGPLVDVGPGLTHDPWWHDPNGQPGARNGAGLEATPAAWRALGFDPQVGKVRVNFELINPPADRTASWTPQGCTDAAAPLPPVAGAPALRGAAPVSATQYADALQATFDQLFPGGIKSLEITVNSANGVTVKINQ
jgi:hypothetical protein